MAFNILEHPARAMEAPAVPPTPPQTPFASVMQLFKILAVVLPSITVAFLLFDRAASLIQMFDGVTNHLSTLDNSVSALNGAVATLSTTVAGQSTTMITHTAQLQTQTDALTRIENRLAQQWGSPPARQAYSEPDIRSLFTYQHFNATRHPCDKPSKKGEHC